MKTTRNRERLLDADIAKEFLSQTIKQVHEKGWASDEHFTVDGTLIEAWASLKSFQPKDRSKADPSDDPGNPTVNFHGEKRSNQTHESTIDADAKLARKGNGKEANLLVETAMAWRECPVCKCRILRNHSSKPRFAWAPRCAYRMSVLHQ